MVKVKRGEKGENFCSLRKKSSIIMGVGKREEEEKKEKKESSVPFSPPQLPFPPPNFSPLLAFLMENTYFFCEKKFE